MTLRGGTGKNRGTGVVASRLEAASVGTSLDRDGHTWNPVDPDRVDRLIDPVRTLRKGRRVTNESGPASQSADVPQAGPH